MLQLESLTRSGLESCAFSIDEGESLFVTGPSGAGKSLLLRAIADLDPNEAKIQLNRQPRSSFKPSEWRRQVMYFAAESGWWAHTVGEHFDDVERAKKLLSDIDMAPDCLSWQIRRLSSGEKQRLALLRGLLLDPKVLLLDEPTSALDADSIDRVEAILKQYKSKGGSILIVTHNKEQVKIFGPRGLQVKNGQVTEVTV